ncbi:hypothetical protein PISMIDRAFT_113421, partial [Pisolithus microcarpus 441]
VGKDRGCGESFLEAIEGVLTVLRENPRGILPCEMSKGYHYIRVVIDKLMVKVGKAQEGLNALHLTRFRPVSDGLNLTLGHCQTIGREKESKVFDRLGVGLTLLRFGIETVFPESAKNLVNMFFVVFYIVRVHKDRVDEMLECCRGVGKSKWHDKPFIGSITSPEGRFPFISISNVH